MSNPDFISFAERTARTNRRLALTFRVVAMVAFALGVTAAVLDDWHVGIWLAAGAIIFMLAALDIKTSTPAPPPPPLVRLDVGCLTCAQRAAAEEGRTHGDA